MVGILGPGPFKVRGARFHPGPPPLQACSWPGTPPFCEDGPPPTPVRGRRSGKISLPVETQAKLGGSGRKGARILALSLTYPSLCKLPSAPRTFAFSSFLPPSFPFFSVLYSFLPSFLPFLFFFYVRVLCIQFSISTSSPPQLFFLEGSRAGLGEPCVWGGVFFCAPQVEVGICWGRARVGAAVEGCGSGLGVPLHRQGLGYDHDRMAAALRSYFVGWQRHIIKGHSRRFCMPMPRA